MLCIEFDHPQIPHIRTCSDFQLQCLSHQRSMEMIQLLEVTYPYRPLQVGLKILKSGVDDRFNPYLRKTIFGSKIIKCPQHCLIGSHVIIRGITGMVDTTAMIHRVLGQAVQAARASLKRN